MALTSSRNVVGLTAAQGFSDTAPTATLVKDIHAGPADVRGVIVNCANPAAAVYLQIFNSDNPSLGTDWSRLLLFVPASTIMACIITGDGPLPFSASVTYAMTDAAKGSTMTGGTRSVFIVTEDQS